MAENMNYDQTHMSKLQQDAIRRAREMQARARPTQQRNMGRQSSEAPPPVQNKVPQRPPEHIDNKVNYKTNYGSNNEASDGGHSGGLFDYLMNDSERTLILFLLILLLEEKADTGLIFALIYLLI